MGFCLCLALGHSAGTWKHGDTLLRTRMVQLLFHLQPLLAKYTRFQLQPLLRRKEKKLCQDKFSAIGSLSKAESLRCLLHSDLQASKIPSKLYLLCTSTQQIIRFGSEKQDFQSGKHLNSSLETFSSVCPDHFIEFMSTSYPSTLI